MLSPRLQLLLESLQKLLRRDAIAPVGRMLQKQRAADVALVMRFLDDRQQRRVFDLLPDDDLRAEMLTELDDHLLPDLLIGRPAEELAGLVQRMSADDGVDVLAALPEDVQQQVIDAMKPDEAEGVEELLHYQPDSAGGIMSPDFFSLPETTSAEDAIAALRSAEDVEMAFYIYVVTDSGNLVGVVSLRALVTCRPKTPLSALMATDVVYVTVDTDQEEVARQAARYNLLAVPVVDEANHLVGIVTIDDVIDVIREEATEDILKMAGADETAYQGVSLFRNFRTRAPWLFATWIGGLGGSMLIGAFERQLHAQVALAAFIPIVLGMGGNVGTQTATIMVRGIATGRVAGDRGWAYLGRESGIGLMMGLLYGVLLAAYALARYAHGSGTWQLAATVGVSILSSMVVAATVGASIPLLLDRAKIDPAVATGPLVTTIVDLLGILVYFSVATLMHSAA